MKTAEFNVNIKKRGDLTTPNVSELKLPVILSTFVHVHPLYLKP